MTQLFFILFLVLIIVGYFWNTRIGNSQNLSPLGICQICDKNFLDSELIEIDEMYFCKKDAEIYKNSEWTLFKTLEINQENLNDATQLQDLKDHFKIQNIPSYIISSYTENDSHITTKSMLYIRTKELNKNNKS